MYAKRIVAVLFLVAIVVCSATVMSVSSELQALDTGGSGATVVSLPPEVESVMADPAVITIVPGLVISGTFTAEVFAPCGVDWIEKVEITGIEPYYDFPYFKETYPLPMEMKRVSVEGLIRATYEVTVEYPSCLPGGEYIITVTATDKDGNTDTCTVSLTVMETLAFSVTDVEFGSVAPGKSSEASSTVTNLGNVRFTFDKKDGIVPTDMHSMGSGIIKAENIAVDWDWKTVITRGFFSPGENIKDVPFTLSVPYGTQPGAYTGKIAFTPTPAE